MAIQLNNNIIKIVYDNIDLTRTSLSQNHIKNKSLLENVLKVININLEDFHMIKKPIAILKNFKYAVCIIEMLRNGNLIIATNEGILKVFDPSSNFICIKELSIHQQCIYNILILTNGKIITRSWDNLILWNPITFDYKELVGHKNYVRGVLELENGLIVSSGGNSELILWDEDIYVKTKLINDTITKLQLLFNNRFLGLSGWYIYIFDYDLNVISQHKHDTFVVPITFETLNKELICCYEKRFIEVYSTGLSILNRIQIPWFTVQFAKLKEQDIMTVCDKTITVWNAYKQSEEQVYQCDWALQKIFSFKNCLVITTSKDNKCRLWYYNKRLRLLNTFEGHDKEVNYTKLIGDYLITASFDNTCMIYKTNN
jgi:WD40 repeat protein